MDNPPRQRTATKEAPKNDHGSRNWAKWIMVAYIAGEIASCGGDLACGATAAYVDNQNKPPLQPDSLPMRVCPDLSSNVSKGPPTIKDKTICSNTGVRIMEDIEECKRMLKPQ